jgi:hypothetical protein
MKQLIKSYSEYLQSITRPEMFKKDGSYNETLVDYHNRFKQYSINGNKEEQIKANFLLSII